MKFSKGLYKNDPANTIVLRDVSLGRGVIMYRFVNAYKCEIGSKTSVGAFVEIQKGVVIGKRCKIQSHTFICEGVTIEDECFIGHGVVFTNDDFPRACEPDGKVQDEDDWTLLKTAVRHGASIGSGAVIRGGIEIGEGAMVGAGAVVVHDVPPNTVVVGNPARFLRMIDDSD